MNRNVGIINANIELLANGYRLPKFTIWTRMTKTIRTALEKSSSLLCFIQNIQNPSTKIIAQSYAYFIDGQNMLIDKCAKHLKKQNTNYKENKL